MNTKIFLAIALSCMPVALAAQLSWQIQFPSLPVFSSPVELVSPHDGTNRFFVVQQRGIIYVFENDPGVDTRSVFLDISDRVSQSGSETGLLGLAFHPCYPDTPYCYVNYTNTTGSQLRSFIARYTVNAENPDSALHDSELILLTVDQPYSNHNGGKLNFGPDGYLYIGFGDGGSGNDPENRAQDLTTVLGKILRIDVDSTQGNLNYAVPCSNPFAQNGSGYREEIFAYGIRNPWKFSFDRLNGALWLGDVGQNAREEIDTVTNGGNYGWRLMEGFLCTPGVNPECRDTAGLIRPVYDYSNLNPPLDGSITGGYVYRGSALPSLYGKYIYGDYVSGRTYALTYGGQTAASASLLSDESYSISTFGIDASGNMYLCSYSLSDGRIYKLVEQATSAETPQGIAPKDFRLFQNHPNPFNPKTVISYRLPAGQAGLSVNGRVSLKVYDLLGREVAVLADEEKPAGTYSATFDATGIASGVYIVKFIVAGEKGDLVYSAGRKMLLAK